MRRPAPTTKEIGRPLAYIAGWLALFIAPAVLQSMNTPRPPIAAFSVDSSRAPKNLPGRKSSNETAFWADTDGDGLPDGAEMKTFQDRDSFRRWFTAIAEMQFYRLNEQWNAGQRDCAGLVRFAWREALRSHDHAWFRKMGPEYETVAPDIEEFRLDNNPLGEKLFRTDFGSFKQTDVADGKFAEFADARTLKSFNSRLVTRDRHQALPGDLLFYYQPWAGKFPYHVMVFLGEAHIAAEGGNDWVVYHTGSSPTDNGTVKKVRLSVLDHHPDPRWRPIESNRNFLGFYRLKILE